MSRHGNRDNFRDYEEGDHLEWNISRWWAQNLGQLLEYSRLESTFTTSALSVLLSPQPVWLFIASHLRHQLTLFHTRHLVPLILIAWCSWEIKDLYFIGPFCLLTESKPVTNAAILRFELFTGLSLWGPLGPGRVTTMNKGLVGECTMRYNILWEYFSWLYWYQVELIWIKLLNYCRDVWFVWGLTVIQLCTIQWLLKTSTCGEIQNY